MSEIDLKACDRVVWRWLAANKAVARSVTTRKTKGVKAATYRAVTTVKPARGFTCSDIWHVIAEPSGSHPGLINVGSGGVLTVYWP